METLFIVLKINCVIRPLILTDPNSVVCVCVSAIRSADNMAMGQSPGLNVSCPSRPSGWGCVYKAKVDEVAYIL